MEINKICLDYKEEINFFVACLFSHESNISIYSWDLGFLKQNPFWHLRMVTLPHSHALFAHFCSFRFIRFDTRYSVRIIFISSQPENVLTCTTKKKRKKSPGSRAGGVLASGGYSEVGRSGGWLRKQAGGFWEEAPDARSCLYSHSQAVWQRVKKNITGKLTQNIQILPSLFVMLLRGMTLIGVQ